MDQLPAGVHYWLVQHPEIRDFEWKQGRTWGASPGFLSAAVLSYLSLTYLLLLLRRRGRIRIRQALIRRISAAHNLFLLLLSLAMAAGCALSTLAQMTGPRWVFCFPANQTPPRGPVFFWTYVFYLSKLAEFADTLLIIAGEGRGRLTFLHVYHHAVVVVMCYLWLETSQSLVPVALATNAAVHVLMYAYYLMCAVGRRPGWKKAVTDVQIWQFVVSFVASGGMLYLHFTGGGGGCSGMWGWCFNAVFNASLLALFLNFHANTYATATDNTNNKRS